MLNGCYSIARQALAFNWLDRIFDPDSLTLLGLHIHSTTYLKYVKCWRLNLVNFVWDSSFIQQLEFLYYRLSAWISTNTPLVYLRPATLNVILTRYFIYRLFVMNYDLNVPVGRFTVRLPRRVLFRPPGPADNAGTGRTSIWTHAETHCAISNTSLLLAREIHPDKKNFALEHCQPAPTVGNPLEWQMNGHLSRYNWPLNIRFLVLQASSQTGSMLNYGI